MPISPFRSIPHRLHRGSSHECRDIRTHVSPRLNWRHVWLHIGKLDYLIFDAHSQLTWLSISSFTPRGTGEQLQSMPRTTYRQKSGWKPCSLAGLCTLCHSFGLVGHPILRFHSGRQWWLAGLWGFPSFWSSCVPIICCTLQSLTAF